MIKRILTLFAAAAIALLAACNTMEGLGKDLKKLGGNIEKKAEENK
jgi:predicted small secreted protein